MTSEKIKNKKVGVLISVHNAENFIDETILSVLNQTHENLHLIIADDASSDGSRNKIAYTINKFMMDNPSKKTSTFLPFQLNLGYARAYNMLSYVANASGCDYVFIVGHDDILNRDCVTRMLQLFEENPEASWVNVNAMMFRDYDNFSTYMPEELRRTQLGIMANDKESTFEKALNIQAGLTAFAMFKIEVWNEYRGYDISITPKEMSIGLEDCELWMRLLRDKKKYTILEDTLYFYRLHNDNNHVKVHPHIDKLKEIIYTKYKQNGWI